MTIRCVILASVATVLSVASTAAAELGEVVDSCTTAAESMRLFRHRALAPIEGVWEMTDGGATVAITANTGTQRHVTTDFLIIYVNGPELSIPRGSVIGRAIPGSSKGIYDAEIYTDVSTSADGSPTLAKPRTFTLTINADSRLALQHYEKGVKVNAWRLVPYILRYSLRRVNQRPANIDGMVRIFPQAPNTSICL